ncbi:MAG: hypothetical protein WD847_05540 [Pirellulales bacterium]
MTARRKSAKASTAEKLLREAELRDLHLVSGSVQRPLTGPPSELHQSITITPGRSKTEPDVMIKVGFLLAPKSDTGGGFRIHAEFALLYRFPSLKGITDRQIEEFGRVDAVVAAWPYWREFIQSMLARIGLPQLKVQPLLRADKLQFLPARTKKPGAQ